MNFGQKRFGAILVLVGALAASKHERARVPTTSALQCESSPRRAIRGGCASGRASR